MNEKYLASIIGGTVHQPNTLEEELAKLSKAELCHRWAEYKQAGQRCFVLKEFHLIRMSPHSSPLGKQRPVATMIYNALYGFTKSSDEKRVA